VPTRPTARIFVPAAVVVALVVVGAVSYQAGTRSPSTSPTTTVTPAGGPGTTTDPGHLKAQPVDVGFAADMIDHHDQAVALSLLAIDRATTSAVRTLALEIATSQRREGGMLLQFLRDRGIATTDPTRMVMTWMDEPTPHDQMPGLATKDEVLALTNATGDDIDRLFVELMIRHHEGGIHMATFAAEHAETQDLRDLASRMVVDQKREIGEMQQLQSG
jgi:uncharacterized protein (DUF305 family)